MSTSSTQEDTTSVRSPDYVNTPPCEPGGPYTLRVVIEAGQSTVWENGWVIRRAPVTADSLHEPPQQQKPSTEACTCAQLACDDDGGREKAGVSASLDKTCEGAGCATTAGEKGEKEISFWSDDDSYNTVWEKRKRAGYQVPDREMPFEIAKGWLFDDADNSTISQKSRRRRRNNQRPTSSAEHHRQTDKGECKISKDAIKGCDPQNEAIGRKTIR